MSLSIWILYLFCGSVSSGKRSTVGGVDFVGRLIAHVA